MNLQEILERRRATRIYDNTKEIDAQIVKECIEKACLTPTSSNMQLWEAYHITDKETLEKLSVASLSQLSAKTAKQLVVFVTRQDKYKEHSKAVLNFEVDKIEKHSPANKKESRKKVILIYYSKLMPFLYSRGLGVWGLVRISTNNRCFSSYLTTSFRTRYACYRAKELWNGGANLYACNE